MTAGRLTPEERTRLIGILGLLGSSFDGERAAAGLLASRLLRDRGLTWTDLLGEGQPREAPYRNQAGSGGLGLCLRHIKYLTEWEQQFVRSLAMRSQCSQKQNEIVRKLVLKLRAWGLD